MNILMAAAECAPFCKTGGLGDVMGSLPKALKKQGADVRVIMPKYGDIPQKFKDAMVFRMLHTVQIGWRYQHCGLFELEHEGVTYYFVDNEFYYRRAGFYGYIDDPERFAFFCQAVLELVPLLGFHPNVIHCHDWQTAMIPVFKHAHYAERAFYRVIRTVFTIHNLRYQGRFGKHTVQDYLNLDVNYYMQPDRLEYYDDVNWMKGAIVFSDVVTTVSPTYAEEIQSMHFGEGLHGLLTSKRESLKGILNGIDDEYWDSNTDRYLVEPYKTSLPKKRKNKTALQAELGLPVDDSIPMIAIVTRLVEQKGIDLISCVFDEIAHTGAQIVLLGAGDYHYEEFFRHAASKYPASVSIQIKYDEGLAHRIYASCDMFLMPSAFEPCGIGQLIALRYLSIPIVRETGGLKDTVLPWKADEGSGHGFTFIAYNAHDMLKAIHAAVKAYADQDQWTKIVKNASKLDFSWEASANTYIELYQTL